MILIIIKRRNVIIRSDRNIMFVIGYLDTIKNWVDPISKYLKNRGYVIHILHMQSLNFGVATDGIKVDPDYLLYDAGEMNLKSIERTMKSINPVATIFPSFKSLFEVLLLKISQTLSIKTIYYQHGLYEDISFDFKIANKKSSITRYLVLLSLVLQFVLYISKQKMRDLLLLFTTVAFAKYDTITFDHFILYSKYSHDMLMRRFSNIEDRVLYSGYPIVASDEELRKFLERSEQPTENYVLYLHQTFVRLNLTRIDYPRENAYLLNLSHICRAQNYKLVIRLHPRETIENYKLISEDDNIIMKQSDDLLENIISSKLVIGHYSTALFSSILLYKPILILYYPELKVESSVFKNFGVHANDANQFRKFIEDENSWRVDEEQYKLFIDYYIGTNNSYENLANNIASLCEI